MAMSGLFKILAFLAVATESARIKRKKDCYSKYDGQTLLTWTPCTKSALQQVSDLISKSGCTLLEEGDLVLPSEGCASTDVVCSPKAAAAMIESRSDVVVVSDDAGAYWRVSSGMAEPYNVSAFRIASNDFYLQWRDLDARESMVESLVSNSGGVAKLEVAGKTLQGREMRIVRFTGKGYAPGKKKVLFTFNLHAREWLTGMSGVYAVEEMIKKVKADPSYLDDMEVVMMPMSNPDGFVRSVDSDRMHRKNGREVGRGCTGVDLNRNFDAHWASGGSSNDPCQDTFHGPKAMSEPESLVVASVIEEAPLTAYIDIHAYSQLVLTAYGWTSRTHPREPEYRTLMLAIQSAIKQESGNTWTAGPIAKTLYAASGSTVDYADDRGALSICFEVSPGRYGGGGFAPPASAIFPGVQECWAGLVATMEYVKDPPPTLPPTQAPACRRRWFC